MSVLATSSLLLLQVLKSHARGGSAVDGIVLAGILFILGFLAPEVHHAFRVLGYQWLAEAFDRHAGAVCAVAVAIAPSACGAAVSFFFALGGIARNLVMKGMTIENMVTLVVLLLLFHVKSISACHL